jgi:hypothetical protein
MRLSFRSGGWIEDAECEVEARNQRYMSLAPRFWMDEREEEKVVRWVDEVSKAARSAMRMAGCEAMVPRREMRRPAWSVGGISMLD